MRLLALAATACVLAACNRLTPEEERLALQAVLRPECHYVGEWRATRPGADYTVTLQDDGRFHAAPTGHSRGATLTGRWGLLEGRMVWLYDQMPRKKPEVNAFEDITPDVFDVIEEDASKTRYMRLGDRRPCR